MTPIEGPQHQTAWIDPADHAQPGRVEFTARRIFYIHAISIAAHCAALGYEVERVESTVPKWQAPIVAKRDADRYVATLAALNRGLKARRP